MAPGAEAWMSTVPDRAAPVLQAALQPTPSADAPPPVLPLAERVLARLPGRRIIWVVAWAALPFVYTLLPERVNPTADQGPGWGPLPPGTSTAAVYAYAITLSLWAGCKMTRDAQAVEQKVTALRGSDAESAFRGLGGATVPIGLTVTASTIGTVVAARAVGPTAALLLTPVSLLANLPLMTALWIYLAVLLGLDRLGGQKLCLDDAFPADPLLGLRPAGSLAFTAFLIMVTGFIPVLVASFSNPAFLLLDLLLFLVGVTLFFLSVYRLHRQMAVTKRRHIRRARELYGRAYGPVWSSTDLEDWRRESSLLAAVGEIEHRATTIGTWPFSPAVTAWVLGISTGLTVTTVGRLLIGALRL